MKQKRGLALSLLLVVVALSVFATVYAKDHDEVVSYKLIATISIPGFGNGFDISWVDSEAGRYYLANRGNPAANPPLPPDIDVIDTTHLTLLAPLTAPPAGNGIMVIPASVADDDDREEK